MKRIFDIVLSAVALVIAAPLFLFIAILLYIDSPGPVIFSQKRLGKNGKPFNVHKFRKFPPDWGDKGPGVTVSGDARMTRFGAFLERTKLDELPQLWNILIGEMSFVGPRPESMRYAHLFVGTFKEVLDYKPGIFGPNQIAFRNESRMYPIDQDPEDYYAQKLFPKKAKIDNEYFKQSNLLTDIGLINKGLFVTLFGAVNWKRSIRSHLLPMMLDIFLIELAWLSAFYFRFDGRFLETERWLQPYVVGTWLIPVITVPMLLFGRVYSRPIRYFSLADARGLTIALTLGWIGAQLLILGGFFKGMSIGVGAIGLFLAIFLLVLPRLIRRDYWFRSSKIGNSTKLQDRILIYGTDRVAIALSGFIKEGFSQSNLTGYIEDFDLPMMGRRINGAKVLGSSRDLKMIFETRTVTQIWLCDVPSFDKLQYIKNVSRLHGVKVIDFNQIEEFCDLLARNQSVLYKKNMLKKVAN